jgi:predicted dehydrogenase
MRVGVAGVGRLGAEHARILSELDDCQLVGVHDSRPQQAAAVAARCATEAVDDLSELAVRVDALVVSVPTRAHHDVALQALSAGCHVLVEKPLTPTLEEADDLIELAASKGLFLAVGHVERFNPAIRAGRRFLENPRFIASQRLARYQPRGTDVPVMLDLMIHDIDLVLGLVESQVARVHALGVPVLTQSVDMANARIIFENGAVADISASRVSLERARTLRLFQPSGYMSLDLVSGQGEFLRRKQGVDATELWSAKGVSGISLADLVERVTITGDQVEPLRLELEAFLDSIRGRDSRSVSAAEGRAALEIALRIERQIELPAHVSSSNP